MKKLKYVKNEDKKAKPFGTKDEFDAILDDSVVYAIQGADTIYQVVEDKNGKYDLFTLTCEKRIRQVNFDQLVRNYRFKFEDIYDILK